jgi:hypothetical protein
MSLNHQKILLDSNYRVFGNRCSKADLTNRIKRPAEKKRILRRDSDVEMLQVDGSAGKSCHVMGFVQVTLQN